MTRTFEQSLEDYMNEFAGLKAMLNNLELGIMTFDEILEYLKKEPIKTYEERAKIFNYDLNIANREYVERLNSCAVEINERFNKGVLTKNNLKEIVNKAYEMFYGFKAFELEYKLKK